MQPTATPTPTTSADALTQLQQYQGSLQSPQAALDAAKGALNVGGAQTTATGLQGAIQNTTNLLNQVAPSVYGNTANSLVTSAQATGQIQNREAPLNTQLDSENTDYTNAEKNYEDLLGQAESQAGNTITQQQAKESNLENVYNDLYTKESDAAKLAEQAREANQSASSSGGIGSLLGNLLGGGGSGGSGAATTNPDQVKSQASSEVSGLFASKSYSTILDNLTGIMKSAANGNSFDQMKLELARSSQPGLFHPDGTLNTNRLAYLQQQGLLK